MKNQKSNRWCFTAWDFNSIMQFTANKKHLIRCCVIGKEICPTTKKLHFQGYIEFVKEYEFSSVRRIWTDKQTHFEIARESKEVCIKYCLKENDSVIQYGIVKEHLNWKDELSDVFSV